MSFFKRIFCLFWFSALLLPLDGQNGLERVGVKIYEFEDGLSHRDVYQVGQDQQGFLWVATANGLNRFDSKNFLHFDKDSLLTTQYITEIAFGSGSDGLWLSLPNRLLRFDTEQLAATGVDLSSDNPVAIQNGTSGRLQGDCSFNGLLMDVDNQLWTCIYDSGSGRSHLQCTNEEGVLEQVLPCEGRFENRAVAKWNDHLMVAFDENSLVGIDQSGSIAERYPISDPDDPNARLWITQLQNQGDTLLWALSNSGHVFFLKRETINSNNTISAMPSDTGRYTTIYGYAPMATSGWRAAMDCGGIRLPINGLKTLRPPSGIGSSTASISGSYSRIKRAYCGWHPILD